MAWLSVSEGNTRQLVAVLYELDERYESEGRKATWSIYLTEDYINNGSPIEMAVTEIPSYARTASYIFGNLEVATSYTILVVVSGIIGSADKTFISQQSTSISGGGDYGIYPNIRRFRLERDGIGAPKIKCDVRITNLMPNDNKITIAVIRDDGTMASYYETASADKAFTEEIVLPQDGNTLEFVEYTVRLTAFNSDKVSQQATGTIVLMKDNVSLFCRFIDKNVITENGKVLLVAYEYPEMTADSFNNFFEIVNGIRKHVGLDVVENEVSSGDEMTSALFEDLYHAINDIYNRLGIDKPVAFSNVYRMLLGQHKRILPSVITDLENGLLKLYNQIYGG